MKQALEIAIDYMNERLDDHDAKYKRHPAAELERNNIIADIETVKEALDKQTCEMGEMCLQCPDAEPKQEQGEPVAWMASDDPSAIETNPPHPELIHQWVPLYTTQPKQEQGEPDYKALWQQICERCDELDAKLVKQDQDYPFGVYGAEDLDRAWKSGYDNCKAQSLWTLEDVKKAWKSGYDAAKQEQGEPVGQVSNYDTKTGFLYKDLEHGTLLYTTSQQPVIDKSSAIRIATALGWTPPNQERDESEMWATKEDFYRELDLAVNHALQQVEVKSVTMRCASGDIALPIIESRNGRILVEQVIAPQNRTWAGMTEEDFVCVHQLCDTPIKAAEYVDHLLKEKNSA